MSDQVSPEIDALLTKTHASSAADVPRRARSSTTPNLRRAARDPEAFWASFARELEWIKPWTRCSTGSRPHAKWFVGGKLNASVNCLDRHVRTAAPQQGGAHLGRRAGRPPDAHLLRSPPRGLPVRQRAEVARRHEGRSRRALHAADPGAGDRDAGVRAHRRRAQRGVRRLQRRVAARSHQRRAGKVLVTADGGYRRGQIVPLKQMADEALAGDAVDRARRRRPAAARPPLPGAHEGGRDHW